MIVNWLWILTIALYVVSFLGIIIFASLFTKPFDEEKFSFTRVFPFEVPANASKNKNIYNFFLYLFGGMSFTPIFSMIDTYGKLQNISLFSVFIVCIFGLAAICFTFLHFFNVTHVKPHLTLFGLFLSLSLFANLLTCVRGLLLYKTFLDHNETMPILLISGVFAGIFAILLIVIAINPKLALWAKLDKVEGQENAYKRPKKFPLAYSEWVISLLLFLGEITLFLQLIVQ